MECPICLEADFTGFVATRCGHVFHERCVTTWWKPPNENQCPTCKKNVALLPLCGEPLQKLYIDSEECPPRPLSPGPSTGRQNLRQQLDTNIRDLERQVQNHIWEMDRVNQELNEVRDQCGELTVISQAAAQELETLHTQIDESRVAKEIAITEKLSQAECFEMQLGEQRHMLDSYVKEVEVRNKKVADLERKVDALTVSNNRMQANVNDLTAHSKDLEETNTTLQRTNADLQAYIRSIAIPRDEGKNGSGAMKRDSPLEALEALFNENVFAVAAGEQLKCTKMDVDEVDSTNGDEFRDSGKSSSGELPDVENENPGQPGPSGYVANNNSSSASASVGSHVSWDGVICTPPEPRSVSVSPVNNDGNGNSEENDELADDSDVIPLNETDASNASPSSVIFATPSPGQSGYEDTSSSGEEDADVQPFAGVVIKKKPLPKVWKRAN